MSESRGYQAIRSGAGLVDLSENGKIRLSGDNAIQFLNGLVSNDVKSTQAGEGVLVAFPNLQGKLLALARVYNIGEGLLLEVEAINHEKVVRNLSRFIPAGGFFVDDQTARLNLFGLEGPRAGEVIAALGGIATMPDYGIQTVLVDGFELQVTSHRRCGEIGYDLFVPVERRDELLACLSKLGVTPVTPEDFETARIEAGVPREGVDAGEEYIVLETGLAEAISYTKGCYLGQEVIARIHWRGQPARQLRGLLLDTPVEAAPALELRAVDGAQAGRRIGNITSATLSPVLGRPIALGYVHRYYLTPGTAVEIWRDEQCLGRATVNELPLVKAAVTPA